MADFSEEWPSGDTRLDSLRASLGVGTHTRRDFLRAALRVVPSRVPWPQSIFFSIVFGVGIPNGVLLAVRSNSDVARDLQGRDLPVAIVNSSGVAVRLVATHGRLVPAFPLRLPAAA